LYIDDVNQQFWFDGSAEGSPNSSTLAFTWGDGGSGDYIDGTWIGITSAFSVTGNDLSSVDLYVNRYSGIGTVIQVGGLVEINDSFGITADSAVKFSFTEMDPLMSEDLRAGFVGCIGSSIDLFAGSGLGQVSVLNGSVPEPSTYAAFAGLCALSAAAYARRRKASDH
jgi:hypothetical protein